MIYEKASGFRKQGEKRSYYVDFPFCKQERKDCFANVDGNCSILVSTNFGDRTCPFYKTKKQLARQEEMLSLKIRQTPRLMTAYRLEKLVDGEWWYYGTYKSIPRLGEAIFLIGRSGYADDVRTTEVKIDENGNEV